MLEVELIADEAIEIRRLCRSLGREYESTDEESLLRDLSQLPGEMPSRVVEEISSYMESPEADFALVRHHRISERDLGRTPVTQKDPTTTTTSLEYEMVLMVYGSILGSVFGWATQQEGHLVNDVIPIETAADSHTEDADHPGRADFICLFCLRNPMSAPTTVASLASEHPTDVVLRPGDLLILNNHRAVHDRRPFRPTHSRRERWLKRVCVARDLDARSPYRMDRDRRLLA